MKRQDEEERKEKMDGIVEIGVWEELVFFFFKQKTAYEIYQCDWSSDVCSSDLVAVNNMVSAICWPSSLGVEYTASKAPAFTYAFE